MLAVRVIPALLLRRGGLVKTVKFKDASYVGDPINAVRIFNDKEVDELVFLDIEASISKSAPNYELLAEIATEAFMPFAYGGGINSLAQAERLFALGVEKVVLTTAAAEDPALIAAIAAAAGSSSVVVGIDVRRKFTGSYHMYVRGGSTRFSEDPEEFARKMEARGAGEILVQSIDRDGTGTGYDLEIIGRIARAVSVPVIALGGAGSTQHFRAAADTGAAAVAAGSMFVYHGKHRAVLITYPQYDELLKLFQ